MKHFYLPSVGTSPVGSKTIGSKFAALTKSRRLSIIQKALLLFLLPLATQPATAYDCFVNGIYYNLLGNEATVTDYDNSCSGNVVIPKTISYESKQYKVIAIGEYAFMSSYSLTSVTIPNTIKTIGDGAFSECI